MTTPPDFATIDRQIEDLQHKLDGCEHAMTLSRGAIVVAAITLALVLTIAGSFRTPTVVFSAIAAMIGGTVWFGASRSTLQETREQLAALDAVKNKMIDKVAEENGWRDLTPTVH